MVVDTGGIDLQSDEPLGDEVRRQAHLAPSRRPPWPSSWSTASMGVAPQDHEIAAHPAARAACPCSWPSTSRTPRPLRQNLHEYWQLGLGEPIGRLGRARPGRGRPAGRGGQGPAPDEEPGRRRSRPSGWPSSAGRTSARARLLNALLGDQRTIVSPHPGHHPRRHRHRPGVRGHADDPGRHGRSAPPGQAHHHRRGVLQLPARAAGPGAQPTWRWWWSTPPRAWWTSTCRWPTRPSGPSAPRPSSSTSGTSARSTWTWPPSASRPRCR